MDNNNENKPSSTPSQVVGAIGTAVDILSQGIKTGKFISKELFQERIKICQECPFYDSKQIRCKDCGCFLKIKASFIASKCPQKKW